MLKPDANESDIQMSDVLCDFCRREWTEDIPFVEGHRGRVICGHCLSIAYTELVIAKSEALCAGFSCMLCREGDDDRAALERAGEAGWASPLDEDAAICRRCCKRAAGALHKDPDFPWKKPVEATD